jgi:hypothetical protein
MLRFAARDVQQDDIVEALVDDFTLGHYDFSPVLWADAYTLSAASGGAVNFSLDAGATNGNRPYLLLGSLSGTEPGTPLPGGAVLPLNWDIFTSWIAGSLTLPLFTNFTGVLDGEGTALATLDTLGPLDPGMVGMKMYFAYLLTPLPFFTSNALTIRVGL